MQTTLNQIEQTQDQQTEKELRIIFGAAFLLTMFLFYIDEGYYSFQWMTKWLNWLIFFIYFVLLSFGQLLVLKLTSRIKFSYGKMGLVSILGMALALFVAFKYVFNAGLS